MWDLLDQRGILSGSKVPDEQLRHCVAEAIRVAWGLITSIPPQISSCEPKDHLDSKLHEVVGGSKPPPGDGKYKLIYRRPVLYTSCAKKVEFSGRVRIVQSDDATTQWVSDVKTSSIPNSSGAKILTKGDNPEFCMA